MAAKRDCYEVLGVDLNASADEIRKAFRREALKYHPDRNQGDKKAEARFKEVNEAYQVLSDDTKRRIYDQYGWAGLEQPGGGGGGGPGGFEDVQDVFTTMQDVFSEIFGGKAPPGRRGQPHGPGGGGAGAGPGRRSAPWAKRGGDLRIEFTLTMREAAFGCKRTIPVRSASMCTDCDGTGARRGTKPEVCAICQGSGETAVPRGFVMFQQPCPGCHGAGFVIAHLCERCHGAGAVEYDRSVDVHFPPGIGHGERVTVTGYGMPGVGGGLPGDLYVEVMVTPDPRFRREKDDLVTEVHILFTEALLGGEIRVPLLDPGREDATVLVTLPPGTQPGAAIRLHGQGVSRWDGSRRGALVIIVHVDLPIKISERARALVAELDAEIRSNGAEVPPKRIAKDESPGDGARPDVG
jgi:molecular chaperone DnaJ